MTHDYTSCTWLHEYSNSKASIPIPQTLDNDNFNIDNQTQRFLERYFDAYYIVDSGSQMRNDLCILRHSNGLCVVGLAPGNHIFKGCYPNGVNADSDDGTLQPKAHCILGLDFQVSNNVNRLRNHVQGRRKHGGHVLQTPHDVVAYAVCDQGIRHPIHCAIPGRLLEVNSKIAVGDSLAQQSGPNQTSFAPLGGLCLDSMGSFICITMPNLVMKRGQTQKPGKQINTDAIFESEDLSNPQENQIDLSTQTQNSDFSSKLANSFGLNVLNWTDYCKLRNIEATLN